MKIVADLHTHTIACTHAYGTITEMANAAKEAGLCAIAITDHGPAVPDSPHLWHFTNMQETLPERINGVVVLSGIEANIVDVDGNIDMDDEFTMKLDWVIASFHDPVLRGGMEKDFYTEAWLNVIKNPYIDALGHSGGDRFVCDYDEIARAAAKNNKVIEINNLSFKTRRGSTVNCREIALKCIKYGTKVAVTSDAHAPNRVGNFDAAIDMLKEINMSEELIINSSLERFKKHLDSRADKRIIVFE